MNRLLVALNTLEIFVESVFLANLKLKLMT